MGCRRAHRDVGKAQPPAHAALVQGDPEQLRGPRLDVRAAPAHALVRFQVRLFPHPARNLRLLLGRQARRSAAAVPVGKARHAVGIVAVDPIAQELPVPAANASRPRACARPGPTPTPAAALCSVRVTATVMPDPDTMEANQTIPRRAAPTHVWGKANDGWYRTSGPERLPIRCYPLRLSLREAQRRGNPEPHIQSLVLNVLLGWTAPDRHLCAKMRLLRSHRQEPSMDQYKRAGINTSKQGFQPHRGRRGRAFGSAQATASPRRAGVLCPPPADHRRHGSVRRIALLGA